MKQLRVEANGTADADLEAVWSLVSDANSFCRWGPWNDSGYDPPSEGPSRQGSIQWFQFGRRTKSVEKVLEVEAPRRLVYTVIRGIPVKNYRAEMTLNPTDTNGTSIRWTATWDKTFMGKIVHRKLQQVYPQIVTGLIEAVNRDAANPDQ